MTTAGPPEPVLQQASEFADDVGGLLAACFSDAPGMDLVASGSKVRIAPSGQNDKAGGAPLKAQGETLAWLRVDFLCRLDAAQQYMAIDKSKIWVVAEVDSTPIFRFEFVYEAQRVPHSHIQVHGQRGALSHLLSKTGHPRPHEMSALHLPTGGSRFRPALEDVIQFLITDCRFDSLQTWEQAVLARRAEWRRIQVRTAVRGMAEEASEQLRAMGYLVRPPDDGHPPPGDKAFHAW